MKSRYSFILTLLIFIFSSLLLTRHVYAENFAINTINNPNNPNIDIRDTYENKFIWVEHGSDNENLFLYDGSNVRQLTFETVVNAYTNTDAKIDGDYVTWVRHKEQYDGPDQVYLYQISTSETTQITNDNLYYKYNIDISNGKIVWVQQSINTPSNYSLMLYNIQNKSFHEINNPLVEQARLSTPLFTQHDLVWLWGNSGVEQEIFKMDLDSGVISRLTNNNITDKLLFIDNDKIGWVEYDGTNYKILLYDGNTIQQIKNDAFVIDSTPSMVGNYIVWGDCNCQSTNTYFLRIYDISTGETETVANGTVPTLSTSRVVWLQHSDASNDHRIFTKNLLTGEISQVGPSYPDLSSNPLAFGDAILWAGESVQYGGFEVFIANPVDNLPPSVSTITISPSPSPINSVASVSASFTDTDTSNTHTATIDWGDGTTSSGTVAESNGSGSVSGNHTYAAVGVYSVVITVIDNDGASGSSTYQYVSVYNPTNQGLFSAGHKFMSPQGAYYADSTITGPVTFGLSYKYQGTVPTGNKEFSLDFNQANLHFNATDVTFLMTANGIGTLRGTGTINGSGNYTFLVVGDGNANTIRIQIKDQSGNTIYDTQGGRRSSDTDEPITPVTGNVIVH